VPALIAPLDGASSTNPRLALTWNSVVETDHYEVQLDRDPAFVEPPFNTGLQSRYIPPMPLAPGEYFGRVRAVDKAGNTSDWSETRSFAIVAGITAPPIEPAVAAEGTPAETPVEVTVTEEPAIVPTLTPEPPTPTQAPDVPALLLIESDDPQVQASGQWTAHDTPYASGGRYLYSSGQLEDALSLGFTGSKLAVVYVRQSTQQQVVLRPKNWARW
jgi:hypothetical protein